MDDTGTQSTLREWRHHMSRPVTLAVLAGVVAVLAISGPFGTDVYLSIGARAGYWLIVATATYTAGYVVSTLAHRHLAGRLPRPAIVALAGAASGVAASLVVVLANAVTFGIWPDGDELPAFLGTVFAIALIVTAVFDVVATRHGAAAPAVAAPAPILERLPLDRRGSLVALSVEDHYVRIRTTKGEHMVLMRLADAMRETGETAGLQVHRSHWVATGAVTAARRSGDRAILTLATGDEIPVSRRHLPAIRAAGLLPR